MLQQVSILHSFYCKLIFHCLARPRFIYAHELMDIWAVSILAITNNATLTFVCRFLYWMYAFFFSSNLCMYLGETAYLYI